MNKQITSKQNELIKKIVKLQQRKFRQKEQLFIVEGKHLVEEASKNGIVKSIIATEEDKDVDFVVTKELFKYISTHKTPQNIMAICHFKEPKKLQKRVLMLDQIQDPGNLGTLIRTAKAFQFTDVVIKGVDVYNPKVINSSQGSIFNINIIQSNDLTKYLTNDYFKIGAMLNNKAKTIDEIDYKEPLILILGNEGNGISNEVYKKLDVSVYIPIEFESLNVAQAGSILMYEINKR